MITDANIGKNVTPAVFFEHHIRQHAVQYIPGLKVQEMNVRLTNGRRYWHSQFYQSTARCNLTRRRTNAGVL